MALLTNVSFAKPHLINSALGRCHATLAAVGLVFD